MDFDTYQTQARKTAIYPQDTALAYLALGLTGEAGEVAEKVKKILRDKNGYIDASDREALAKESGDVLWYLANLLHHLGIFMNDAAVMNLEKLTSRQKRGKLSGSGDER